MFPNSRRRQSVALFLCTAVVMSLTAVLAQQPHAAALTPGISFSAEDLSTWQTDGVVYALGQSQGKVVAGGTFTELRPPEGGTGATVATNGLAILDGESGAPDQCQLPVAISDGTATVRAVATSPDGNTVYVGGAFGSVGGITAVRLAAIDVATCTVTPFRVNGISSTVRSIAVHDNTVYFAGDFTTVDGQTRQRFAAVDATTGELLPWVADADAPGRAIGISPDGSKVAIGGDFFNVNGSPTHSIAVVDGTTGTNLRTYTNGFIPDKSATKHIWSGNDRFYVSNEGSGGGVFDGRIAISWSTLDQVWRDTCLGATQATQEYRGTLYVASHAHNCTDQAFQDGKRNFFVAQDAATSQMLGWDPRANNGIGEGIGPRALTIVPGRTTGKTYLWYGGEFTLINGAAQQGLTRFGPDDSVAPPVPNPVVEATSEGAIQLRWRSVVDPDDSELIYSVYRSGSTTPVFTGSSSSVWWKRPQLTFVDTDVMPGTTYSYQISATDGTNTSALSAGISMKATAPVASYGSTVRADRPTLYWNSRRKNASDPWIQDVGALTTGTRRINGINSGATASTDSPIVGDTTGSFSYDGTNSYLWEDEFKPGPTTYSMETWVKTTSTSGGQIMGYGNGRPRTDNNARLASTAGKYDRDVYMESAGRVRFAVNPGTFESLRSTKPLNDGVWHHIVATQGPAGMALFVDGVRNDRNAITGAGIYNGVWHVGGDQLAGVPGQPSSSFLNGLIDEVAVYPSVLDRAAVTAHYRAAGATPTTNPRPTDAYGGAVYDSDPDLYWRLAEATGTTAADSSNAGLTPGLYGSAIGLNKTGIVSGNAAVTTPGTATGGTIAAQQAAAPPKVFSAEVWFKTATVKGGKLIGFESAQSGSSPSYDKNLYMTSNGRLVFGVYNGSYVTVASPQSYNNNAWHHAVIGLDGTGQKLYVDGVLVASGSNTTSQTFSGYWRLGGGNLASYPSAPTSLYFDGSLDEFAVYNATLPAAVVSQHYGVGVGDNQPPTAPTGVTGTPSGGGTTLSWTAATDNVGVSGYRVYRGLTSDFVPGAANQVGQTTGTTFSQSVSPGTYYYQVTAFDASGNVGPPSSATRVTVPDTTGPSTPANVTGTVSGPGAVTVTWAESTDDVAVTGYNVYRGETPGFDVGPATQIGVTGTMTTFGDSSVASGDHYYKVVATDAAGNVSVASSAAAVTVPDYTKPTAPSDLNASASSTTVTVTWPASTDDVAVTGYSVYRSRSTGFEADATTKIADVSATTTSYGDSGLPTGTYYYKVRARDAAGNVSAASPEASAAVSVAPVVITLKPTEDARVVFITPDTNTGTDTQLGSTGGSKPLESFLRFSLPTAPAGATLTGVQLAVRTSNDAAAGSVDAHVVYVSTGPWTETGITYNNRPRTIGAKLGTLTGATATNTPYVVTGDPTALAGKAGQSVALRISGPTSGTDNLRLWSREAATAYRPTLTLTYTY